MKYANGIGTGKNAHALRRSADAMEGSLKRWELNAKISVYAISIIISCQNGQLRKKPYLHKGAEDLTNLAYSCDTALCSEVFSGFQNSNSAAGLISHKDRAEH